VGHADRITDTPTDGGDSGTITEDDRIAGV